jgi:hypothetical protein
MRLGGVGSVGRAGRAGTWGWSTGVHVGISRSVRPLSQGDGSLIYHHIGPSSRPKDQANQLTTELAYHAPQTMQVCRAHARDGTTLSCSRK